MSTTATEKQTNNDKIITKPAYSIEYFHIYTDEVINDTHKASLNYLKEAQQAWDLNSQLILLIDNYNPTNHILNEAGVFAYLKEQGAMPHFWAFEGDFISNAQVLLDNITDRKLKKSYEKYIASHDKYPCSLLTASWYLTRLGRLDGDAIRSLNGEVYVPAARLINILPAAYKSVEGRAFEIILKSNFSEDVHNIQDLFYQADAHRKVDLF